MCATRHAARLAIAVLALTCGSCRTVDPGEPVSETPKTATDRGHPNDRPLSPDRELQKIDLSGKIKFEELARVVELNRQMGLPIEIIIVRNWKKVGLDDGGFGGEVVVRDPVEILFPGTGRARAAIREGQRIILIPIPTGDNVIMLLHGGGNSIPHSEALEKAIRDVIRVTGRK
jgi:hypothetical protein